MDEPAIRDAAPSDLTALKALYRDAFPEEDLTGLVEALQREVPEFLSLVAEVDGALAGHVAFTPCSAAGSAARLALLGPLAVASAYRARGLGSALVRTGLARLEGRGTARVFVLGDPAYYGRFGFGTETGIAPPYPLPETWHEAWQSLSLAPGAGAPRGVLGVPPPWRRRALWSP